MGEQWPSMRGRKMKAILVRLCGEPVRQNGSHCVRSPGRDGQFVYGYHDNKDISGGMVRRILVTDLGLSQDAARREVR